MYLGLAALSLDTRAALVASAIERFEPIDVETILDAGPAATRHAIAQAREKYARFAKRGAAEEAEDTADEPVGELASRVQDVAMRAFSSGEAAR